MSVEDTEVRPEAEDKPVKAKPSRPRGYVTLFGNWCKGCGLCVEFCPQGVFELDDRGRPVIAHMEKCTACHWCDTHCPDMAIIVRRLEPQEVEYLDDLASHDEQDAPSAGGGQ